MDAPCIARARARTKGASSVEYALLVVTDRHRHPGRGSPAGHEPLGVVPRLLRLSRGARTAAPAEPESSTAPRRREQSSQVTTETAVRARGRGPLFCVRASSRSRAASVSACPDTTTPASGLAERLRRTSRVADHHRQPAGLRLEEDDPPGLRLEPEEPGPAGHREHVARVGVGRHLLPRHAAGHHDRVAHPDRPDQLLDPSSVRAVADEQQHRPRVRRPHPWPRPDQGVLSLAPDQAGRAHHDRGVRGDAPPLPHLRSPPQPGWNRAGSTPGDSRTIRAAASGERAVAIRSRHHSLT